MKRLLIILTLLFCTCSCNDVTSVDAAPLSAYYAKSYVVMEQRSKEVIASKNPNYVQSVASISKIMTGILAIESQRLDEIVKVGDEITKACGSSVYLQVGAEIKLEELTYGLLLRSGNDCALAIAKHLNGSVEAFVDQMNILGRKIGMLSTTFVNPHGLDEEDGGNLSSAKDMALLLAYALNNETFRKISGTKDYQSSIGSWHNKNRLLDSYEYTTSGKTGYTVHAKRTLATSAKKDNTELIVVTINCSSDFAFHRQLYENFFSLYESRLVVEKGTKLIDEFRFTSEKDYYLFLTTKEWIDSSYLYEINPKENQVSVYVITTNDKYLIETFKLDEAEDNSSSFLNKVKDFFERMFK